MSPRKKSTIYTKKGDSGMTSLASMQKVSKTNLRLKTYGTVDELNAHLGVVLSLDCSAKTQHILTELQHSLFNLGSDLAFENGTHPEGLKRIDENDISFLEKHIDMMDQELPTLRQFILPGGCLSAAHLHVARTVCRRAERLLVEFLEHNHCNPFLLPFLNRLSDLLFVMARYENFQHQINDVPWKK